MLKSISLFRSGKNHSFEKLVLQPRPERADLIDKPASFAEAQRVISSKPTKPQQKKSEPLNLESKSSTELTKKLNTELGKARNVKNYGKVIVALLAEAERKPKQFDLVHLSCFFNKLAKALRPGCDFTKLNQVEKEALAGLSRKAIDFLAGNDRTNGQTIACLMYGFEVLPAELRPDFLVALQKKIPSIADFTGQGMGNALYGLQGMSEVPPELLRALAAKIPSIQDFTGQGIGNALYGLKSMKEVPQELLRALAAKVPAIVDFKEQEIGNMLIGIRNLEKIPLVLIRALQSKIKAMDQLSGQDTAKYLSLLKSIERKNKPDQAQRSLFFPD